MKKITEQNHRDLTSEYWTKVYGIVDSGIDDFDMILIRKSAVSLCDDAEERINYAMRHAYALGYMTALKRHESEF